MQFIQTISATPATEPAMATQPTQEHGSDTQFDLSMGEDKSDANHLETAKDASQRTDEHLAEAPSPTNATSEIGEQDSQGEHGIVASEPQNKKGQSNTEVVHLSDDATTNGISDQKQSKLGKEVDSRSGAKQTSSPISAMIQGLSQAGSASVSVSSSDAIAKPENATFGSARPIASLDFEGISATRQDTNHNRLQGTEPVEFRNNAALNKSPELRTLSRNPNTVARHGPIEPGHAQAVVGLKGEQSRTRNTRHPSELLPVPNSIATLQGTASALKVEFASIPTDQPGGSLLSGKVLPTKMTAPKEQPKEVTLPMSANISASNPNTGTSAASNNANNHAATNSATSKLANTTGRTVQVSLELASFTIDPTSRNEPLLWETRSTNALNSVSVASLTQRAELPQHISYSIAESFKRAPEKPIEIALNPAELGRVRMVMATSETGITVTITADRGDTLDLMRRNIDDLGKSLNDLGFEDVSFAFDQQQHPTEQQEQTGDDDLSRVDEPLVMLPAQPRLAPAVSVPSTGIDMRL